jgi:ElaB/YqjD/DUF883 family membrane-anchored ribosome-binding protein
MATEQTSGRSGGAVAEAKDKGQELVSKAQDQITEQAHELGGQASFQIREQLDLRSSRAGEQVQSIGKVLHSGAKQLRSEEQDMSAKFVEEVARRTDDLGRYLQSARSDRMLHDVEEFARRRPWVTAGMGALAGFLASRFVKASADRRYEGAHGKGRGHSTSTQPSLTTGGA